MLEGYSCPLNYLYLSEVRFLITIFSSFNTTYYTITPFLAQIIHGMRRLYTV